MLPRTTALLSKPITALVAGSLLLALASGCGDSTAGPPSTTTDAGGGGSTGDGGSGDGGSPMSLCKYARPSVFTDTVVSFMPGQGAGFGQDKLPCVVLGPPFGGGAAAGGLDVLSLGREGTIVLKFEDVDLVDRPGPDLLVFENAFSGFVETGAVAVSEDGSTWTEWPCRDDQDAGYPGCAGVHPVLSTPDNGIDPADPAVAGGDSFDLADVGVARARFVRIRDTGWNGYSGVSGGFDLDAVVAIHHEPQTP
jgi:hypothetical protein